MKKLMFILVFSFATCVTYYSCEKANSITPKDTATTSQNRTSRLANNHWFRYDERVCGNPWKFDWLIAPTNEQLAGNLKAYFVGMQINVLEVRVFRNDKIIPSCSDCNCLTTNGIHYFARVITDSDSKQLAAMGFYEVDPQTVPAQNTASVDIK